jgi:threonine dehydrogenase-like Zn-dependent dehydrogenase
VNVDTTGVLDIVKACVKSLHPRGQTILIGVMQGLSLEVDLGDLLAVSITFRSILEIILGQIC